MMNSSDRLYNIKRLESSEQKDYFVYEIKLNAEHSLFRGHFPGMPVLPGVYAIEIIEECISFEFNQALSFNKIETIKFLKPINPEILSLIYLSIKVEATVRESYKITANINSGEDIHVKLKGVLSISTNKESNTGQSDILENKSICVIVPTYNNDRTLKTIIDEILEQTSQLIIVNDGSTDSTEDILSSYKDITIITHEANKGKGAALKSGIIEALRNGYNYIITIDSDGQHSPHDIISFINKHNENPDCLIVGSRNMTQQGIPAKSSFGHKFSNFWYYIETGLKLPDTQSGFRLYPIKNLANKRFYTDKFEFEIEILVRAAWSRIQVESVPISVKYFKNEERVSHFRPIIDFTRISLLNTILVTLALIWVRPFNLMRSLNKTNVKEFITNQIKKNTESNIKIASALGLGVFCGIIPLWGWQMAIAVSVAHIVRLNKIIVLTASNISVPPMIPFILYFSYITGGLLLGKSNDMENLLSKISFEIIKTELLQYVVGSIFLAALSATVVFLVSLFLLKMIRK